MTHIVRLDIDEVRVVAHVAMERWLTKYGSTDRPNYAGENKKFLEPEIAANVRACVAEYAVAKYYKKPWVFPWYPNNEHPWRKDFPDVVPNLEVKTVRTSSEIPVFKKDIRDGVIIVGAKVLDRDYYTEVEIFGWMRAEDVPRDDRWYASGSRWHVALADFNDSPLEA